LKSSETIALLLQEHVAGRMAIIENELLLEFEEDITTTKIVCKIVELNIPLLELSFQSSIQFTWRTCDSV